MQNTPPCCTELPTLILCYEEVAIRMRTNCVRNICFWLTKGASMIVVISCLDMYINLNT